MNAIEINNVTKKFKIYYDKGSSFKEKLLFKNRNQHEDRWVLNGISFGVKKGEAIGLIGQNGCGKSTLLKLMTQIMYPDAGSIFMKGRVSSLIELGAGFHPDMSGRENIYTNASIFGLTRREIDARLQKIIDFSELQDFISNPVRTYSSGMYMRLAFAVAINVDADILLIDEILAVGDAAFQAKCFNKLREIKARGTTIVIVSHSLGQIEQICERSLWIHKGLIHCEGTPREVHPRYMEFMGQKNEGLSTWVPEELKEEPIPAEAMPATEETEGSQAVTSTEAVEESSVPVEGAVSVAEVPHAPIEEKRRWGSGKVKITNIFATGNDGIPRTIFKTGEPFVLHIEYKTKVEVVNAVFGVGFIREDAVYCYGTNTSIDREPMITLSGVGEMQYRVPTLNLLPGVYLLDVAIEEFPGIPLDFYLQAFRMEVYSEIGDIGAVRMEHQWKLSHRER